MIRLEFKDFWNEVEKTSQQRVMCMETPDKFVFLSTFDGWKSYTELDVDTILSFFNDEYDAVRATELFYETYIDQCTMIPHQATIEGVWFGEVEEKGEAVTKTIDMEEQDKAYAEFYLAQIEKWKTKVVGAVDQLSLEKKLDKTFGSFVQNVLNAINTKPFLKKIRVFVKNSMLQGTKDAEEELNVDIGITSTFNKRLLVLQHQQLNGYTINGKKWYGIRGASQELHQKILNQVSEDIKNKVPRSKVVKNIESIFDGVGKSQAERIARTETTRFINEGKLTAYKDSKIEGHKAYSAVMDYKTSDICRRLHNKYFEKGIPFDEEFIDEKTGKSFMSPPTHPNCRCVIEFRKS